MCKGAVAVAVVAALLCGAGLVGRVDGTTSQCLDTDAENTGANARCEYKTILSEQGDWMTLSTYCSSLGYGTTHKELTQCYNEAERKRPPVSTTEYPITCADGAGADCAQTTEVVATSISFDSLKLVESEDLLKYSVSYNSRYTDYRIFDTTNHAEPWLPATAAAHFFVKGDVDLKQSTGSIPVTSKCSTSLAGSTTVDDKAIEYASYGEEFGFLGVLKTTERSCNPDDNMARHNGCTITTRQQSSSEVFITSGSECLHSHSFPMDNIKFCIEFGYSWWAYGDEETRLGLSDPIVRYKRGQDQTSYKNPDGEVVQIPTSLHLSLKRLSLGDEYDFKYWVKDYMEENTQAGGGYAVCYLVSRNLYFFFSKFFLPIQILIYICTAAVYMGPSFVIPRLATLTVAFLTVINSKNAIISYIPKGTGSTTFDMFATISMYYLLLVAIETISVGALKINDTPAHRKLMRTLESVMMYFMLPFYHLVIMVVVAAYSMQPTSPAAIFVYVLFPVSLPFLVMLTCALHHRLIQRSTHITWKLISRQGRRPYVGSQVSATGSPATEGGEPVAKDFPLKEMPPFCEGGSVETTGKSEAGGVKTGDASSGNANGAQSADLTPAKAPIRADSKPVVPPDPAPVRAPPTVHPQPSTPTRTPVKAVIPAQPTPNS